MNKVLCVEFIGATTDKKERAYLDVARGVIYYTKPEDASPVRRVKNRIQTWDNRKKEWFNVTREFNEAYEEYLKVSKLVKNAEMDEAFDEIFLDNNDD